MQPRSDEKTMLLVAMGVVVFSIAAFVIFIVNASQVLFYAVAIIALALGFYLSYNLSRQPPQPVQKPAKSSKGR